MAFLYRGAGTASNGNNSATLTPTLPTGWQVGDLLVVQVQTFGGTNSRVPSMGGTWSSTVWANGTAQHLLAWKIAESGETNPVVTFTGTGVAGDTQVTRCFAFNSDTAGLNIALDVHGATSTNASADNIGPISGITVGGSGSNLSLVSAGKTNDYNGVGTLTNYTQAALTESTTGNDAGMALLYRLATPSGATGSLTVTDNGGTASNGLGFGKIISFTEQAAPITGTATADLGVTVTASGDVADPPITGAATADLGLTVTAAGTLAAAPITGTATASVGITVAASGTMIDQRAPVARGAVRPLRGPRDPRARRRVVPQLLRTRSSVPPITGDGTATVGLTITASGTVAPPAITGDATGLVGLTISASGTHTPPPITGDATALVELTVAATGTAAPPAIDGSALAALGLTVAASGDVVPPPITGTGTALLGVTVTASATNAAAGGLSARGIIRPVRPPNVRRIPSRSGPQLFAAPLPLAVTGSASALLGVTVTATGTATPPSVTGTATALVEFAITATGTVTPPAITGTASALLGLAVTATGDVVAPTITGTATALFGLDVTSTGSGSAIALPPITGRGIIRPTRPRRDPRQKPTAGAQIVARVEVLVTGTASASFGLTVTASATVAAPSVTGTGTATIGLTVTATGTTTIPAIDGAASALLGVSVTATGTFVKLFSVRVVDNSAPRVAVVDRSVRRLTAADLTAPRVTITADRTGARLLTDDATTPRVLVASQSLSPS